MKARFVGDPSDGFSGPDSLTVYGVAFTKGEWASVPSALGEKFANHSHFEVDADADGEDDPSLDDLRAALDALGVKYHPRSGQAKLAALLAEQAEGGGE